MPLPNLGPDADLAQRLSTLERQVGALARNQIGQAFSSRQSDGSVGLAITQDPATGATSFRVYQGPNTARDPNTGLHAALLYIGQLYSGGKSLHAGLICSRENGNYYFSADPTAGFQVYDQGGHAVFAPDELSGVGLALPYLTYPTPVAMGTGSWPSTTSTSWASVAQAALYVQQPRIRWYATTYCPTGTTGQVQLMLAGGVAVSPVHSVGAGFTNIDETLPVPSWSTTGPRRNDFLIVNAAVTAGAGPISVQVFGVQGIQS